jgi:hypothetical protein
VNESHWLLVSDVIVRCVWRSRALLYDSQRSERFREGSEGKPRGGSTNEIRVLGRQV